MAGAKGIKAGDAYVRVYSDDSPLVRGLRGIESKVKKTGAAIGRTGASLATAGTAVAAGVTAAFVGVGSVFAAFDGSMAEVAAVSGASGEALDQLREKAKQLGSETKFSATEAAEGLKYLGMAGFNSAQMLDAIGPVLNVAAAGMLDLGRASDIVSDATTAFGLKAEDTARVADVMAKTATSSNTSIEQMGQAFVYSAAAGKAAGQTIEDVSAALGILGNSGLKASIAGSGVQGMLKRMVQPKTGKFFKELGVDVADATGKFKPLTQIIDELAAATKNMTQIERAKKFEQLFGLHAKTAIILVDNADALRKMTGELQSAEGAASKMAAVMSQSLMGTWLSFKSSIEGVVLALGESFSGAMTTALDLGTTLARSIIKIIDANRGLVAGIGGATMVVGVLGAAVATVGFGLIVLGAAISAIGTVAGAVATVVTAIGSPVLVTIGAVAVGVVAIGSAFAYVANQAGLLGPAFAFIGKSFGRVFGTMSATIGGVINALKSGKWQLAAKIAWAGVQVATLQGAQQVIKGVEYMWNNCTTLTLRFMNSLMKTVVNVFGSLPRLAMQGLRGGLGIAQSITSVLAEAAGSGSLELADKLDPTIKSAQARLMQLNKQAAGGQRQIRPQQQRQMQRPNIGQIRAAIPQPPPSNIPARGPIPQLQVAAAVNESATRAGVPGRAGADSGGALAALLGVNEAQLFALRRLVAQGGLA